MGGRNGLSRHILFCAMVASLLSWGFSYTIGIFYVQWVDYFEATKAEVAVIGGVNTASGSLMGPLYDMIAHRVGYRIAGAVGGMLVVGGLIASAFSSSILMLCVFYGVLAGGGMGLSYYSASLAINQHFSEQRSLADGVATTGAGLGGFALTAIGQFLINRYGWRGAILILSAITAHLIVMFQLMISRSTESKNLTSSPQKVVVEEKESISSASVDETKSQKNGWIRRCIVLFKNPIFELVLLIEFLCWLGFYVPFVHLPERSRLLGMDLNTVGWIASTMSIACLIGRPIICALPNIFTKIDVFYLYCFANAAGGLITMLSPLLRTKAGLFTYAAVYGFLNTNSPLVRSSLAAMLGEEAFPLAYAWILFFDGIALLIGPAMAGLICDYSSYDYSFIAAGSLLLSSGLLAFLKNTAFRLNERRSSGRGIHKRHITT